MWSALLLPLQWCPDSGFAKYLSFANGSQSMIEYHIYQKLLRVKKKARYKLISNCSKVLHDDSSLSYKSCSIDQNVNVWSKIRTCKYIRLSFFQSKCRYRQQYSMYFILLYNLVVISCKKRQKNMFFKEQIHNIALK